MALRPPRESLETRLFGPAIWTPTGCWVSAGQRSGRYRNLADEDGRMTTAHRLAYAFVHGEIPPGMEVCHTCDNPRCFRPAHLFLGTHADNIRDAAAKGRLQSANGRKTRCIQGHPYDEENTYTYGGRRRCRVCGRERMRRLRAAA